MDKFFIVTTICYNMGRRTWELRCCSCNNHFWKVFEHMGISEIIEWLTDTKCPECGDYDIQFTGDTSFSGGNIVEDAEPVLFCEICDEIIFVEVSQRGTSDLKKEMQEKQCPNCNSYSLKITDTYREAWEGLSS